MLVYFNLCTFSTSLFSFNVMSLKFSDVNSTREAKKLRFNVMGKITTFPRCLLVFHRYNILLIYIYSVSPGAVLPLRGAAEKRRAKTTQTGVRAAQGRQPRQQVAMTKGGNSLKLFQTNFSCSCLHRVLCNLFASNCVVERQGDSVLRDCYQEFVFPSSSFKSLNHLFDLR